MMIGQTPENTCFFTGHRSVAQDKIAGITAKTREQICLHAAKGYRFFVCGGAMGFDSIAAAQVLRLKAGGMDIRLILALPCRDQTARWKDVEMIRLYQFIKGKADEIIYISDLYYDGCMKERNQYMADISTACIAYYNRKRIGGTAQTVRMAERKNLSIANVYTAEDDIHETGALSDPR